MYWLGTGKSIVTLQSSNPDDVELPWQGKIMGYLQSMEAPALREQDKWEAETMDAGVCDILPCRTSDTDPA